MSKQVKGVVAAAVAVVVIAGLWRVYNPKPVDTSSGYAAYNCEQGKTAYDIMAKKYTLATKDTSFGKQIVGINNTQAGEKQYWAFYVDGKLAPVGAEAYNCQDSEKVEWKLEAF